MAAVADNAMDGNNQAAAAQQMQAMPAAQKKTAPADPANLFHKL